VKIKLKDQLNRVVTFDPDAGATVGRNLRWPNGQVVTEAELRNVGQPAGAALGSGVATAASTLWRLIREIPANIQALAGLSGTGVLRRTGDSTFDTAATTDDVPEGGNLYFTNTRADARAALAVAAHVAEPNPHPQYILAAALAGLVDAVDDAAAAGLGVHVGAMYRNGSVLMIRIT